MSGAVEDLDLSAARLPKAQVATLKQHGAILEAVVGKPPDAVPGAAFVPSDLNDIVVGAMLEQAAGLTWEDLMRRELFEPLGMTRAGFGSPVQAAAVDPSAPGSAGTVRCALGDLAAYASLHAGEGAPGYLASETLRVLHTALPGADYAAGWYVEESPLFGKLLRHAGGNRLWSAVLRILLDRGGAVMALTNQGADAGEAAADAVADSLIRWFLDED